MRMRVSGERSSCEALASSDLCELHQLLDARRRGVEAARQIGHLVLPLFRHPRRQVAAPQRCTPRCSASSRLVRRRTIG